MTWLPLLLADPSPCLRLLVLRDLIGRPENDAEVQELVELREKDPLVIQLVKSQARDGSWNAAILGGAGTQPNPIATSLALQRLGYLGFDSNFEPIVRGAGFLFSQQKSDGSWPLISGYVEKEGRGYKMIPLQTALPLIGLAMSGYATDPRSEKAYDWLISKRLLDGAWPAGITQGTYGFIGGYRKLAHSKFGCRSNTTAALRALSFHPKRRVGPEARRALDLLLGRETREKHALGHDMARLIGAEPLRGFFTYYALFDNAFILDLCWRAGASKEDKRVADLIQFVTEQQGPYGLWEYKAQPQANRWVTFDILRSLSQLDKKKDWVGLEPRTPFKAYPKKKKRF